MHAGDIGMLALRAIVGLTMAGHGAQKAFGWWEGPGPVTWRGVMERMGMRPAQFWAGLSMGTELVGGLLLAIGFLTPLAAGALAGMLLVIIGRVHLPKGFWNKAGGLEFPLSLLGGVIAVSLAGPGSISIDRALGLAYSDSLDLLVLVLGLIVGLAVFELPRVSQSATPSTSPR